jgi:hypothetical protein
MGRVENGFQSYIDRMLRNFPLRIFAPSEAFVSFFPFEHVTDRSSSIIARQIQPDAIANRAPRSWRHEYNYAMFGQRRLDFY